VSEADIICASLGERLRIHFRAVMPDWIRWQPATVNGGGNGGHVSVSVRVSSALRLASNSKRRQNTIFCLLPTKLAAGRVPRDAARFLIFQCVRQR